MTTPNRRRHLLQKRHFGPVTPISEDVPGPLSVQPSLVQEMMSNSPAATPVSETPTSLVIIPVPSYPRPQGTPGTTQAIQTSAAESHNTASTSSGISGQWTILPSTSTAPSSLSSSTLFVTRSTHGTSLPSSFLSVTVSSWGSSDNASSISISSSNNNISNTTVPPSLTSTPSSPPTSNHNSPVQASNTSSSSTPAPVLVPANRIELLCACGIQCLDPSSDHIGRCEGACFS